MSNLLLFDLTYHCDGNILGTYFQRDKKYFCGIKGSTKKVQYIPPSITTTSQTVSIPIFWTMINLVQRFWSSISYTLLTSDILLWKTVVPVVFDSLENSNTKPANWRHSISVIKSTQTILRRKISVCVVYICGIRYRLSHKFSSR